MSSGRLEAFSDAVIAIVITSLAIFWNNHHHMMFVTERINGAVLWANMHLLFWLSLIPFTTAWMGENEFARRWSRRRKRRQGNQAVCLLIRAGTVSRES